MKGIRSITMALALTLLSAACDNPSDSTPVLPEELLNRVVITLLDSVNQDSRMLSFVDADGPSGSDAPLITGDTLAPGRTYYGLIDLYSLYRGTSDSLVRMTEEVREAGSSHQFFYTPDNSLKQLIEIEITDRDANNLPIGIEFTLRTSDVAMPATGMLNVVLSHFEQQGVKNGIVRSDESDIDIDFPIIVR